MTQPLSIEERQQRFRARAIVRDITRCEWIDNECDPERSQACAQAKAPGQLRTRLQFEYGSIIGAIILAVVVNLISKWIADHIRDWNLRGIKSPPVRYQSSEPGFMAEFEDDES